MLAHPNSHPLTDYLMGHHVNTESTNSVTMSQETWVATRQEDQLKPNLRVWSRQRKDGSVGKVFGVPVLLNNAMNYGLILIDRK